MNRFIIDAETDGLYGKLLTVAVLVTDEHGHEIERFYGGLPSHIKSVETDWVKANVLPVIGDYQAFAEEEALLKTVWDLWLRYRERAICYADVPFPIETQLLNRMVRLFSQNPLEESPFPLIDIASLLLGHQISPLTPRQELVSVEGEKNGLHNALYDVQLSNQLLNRFLPKSI